MVRPRRRHVGDGRREASRHIEQFGRRGDAATRPATGDEDAAVRQRRGRGAVARSHGGSERHPRARRWVHGARRWQYAEEPDDYAGEHTRSEERPRHVNLLGSSPDQGHQRGPLAGGSTQFRPALIKQGHGHTRPDDYAAAATGDLPMSCRQKAGRSSPPAGWTKAPRRQTLGAVTVRGTEPWEGMCEEVCSDRRQFIKLTRGSMLEEPVQCES